MFKEKLAIIVPTKDRIEELSRFLESISVQQVKPVQIIIVDGGHKPAKGLLKKFSALQIDYIRSTPPSLTVQRNIGIRQVRNEATLVAFLDDDIVLEDKCLEGMMRFWESKSEDTAGASFNNISESFNKPALMEKIFFVNAEKRGRILRSGFQSPLYPVKENIQVEWLVGFGMVFRRSVFKDFMFDEYFKGYARYEDVDFSYRVGKKYKIYVIADAKVRHTVRKEDIKFSFSLGKMQVTNRLYFVKKNPNLSVALCYWSCLGLLVNNIVKGFFGWDVRYINRAKGNIIGFIKGK